MSQVEFKFGEGRREVRVVATKNGTEEELRLYRVRPKRISGQEIALFWLTPGELHQVRHLASQKLAAVKGAAVGAE